MLEYRFLFSLNDLRPILPEMSYSVFKSLIARSVKNVLLKCVCHGICLYPNVNYPSGSVLYCTSVAFTMQEMIHTRRSTDLIDMEAIPSGKDSKRYCGK